MTNRTEEAPRVEVTGDPLFIMARYVGIPGDKATQLVKLSRFVMAQGARALVAEDLSLAPSAEPVVEESDWRERDGCPCMLIAPCSPNCTCAKPFLSGGCRRCARYGSPEQRLAAANYLDELIRAGFKATQREPVVAPSVRGDGDLPRCAHGRALEDWSGAPLFPACCDATEGAKE